MSTSNREGQLANEVTLGELLNLQQTIPRGGVVVTIDSTILVSILAELVRRRYADEPRVCPECWKTRDDERHQICLASRTTNDR